ncbi:2-hydroxyacid dehydrogenase [Nocardioides bruguierae]|uniref:2-hydroxyacid dehydrogenase n=1 Tax=Nocardioides bruguierae TaxID=2945102 RepID=A0A9X2IFJ2_9ACTN|nr:2-hydroxyacid dehydrogenase [Nocardioides bruguierae]MCM0621128.1 2-hydroxyacid dehydrogenase [Nocardioides bruguierae]
MNAPLVWLDAELRDLDVVPAGVRGEFVVPGVVPTAGLDEVELFLPGHGWGDALGGLLARMPSLRVVQTLSAGVDLLGPLVPTGVTLCNGREVNTVSTAELAVALTLSSLRDLPRFVRQQETGTWEETWGENLAEQRVLVLGHGSIGQHVGRLVSAFGAEVVPVARTAREGVHDFAELPALLPTVDVVVVIVPLTDETRGMVDEGFLAAMPDGSLLVNVARGPVADTDALTAACASGRLRAALDVTAPEPLPGNHPLWRMPNVTITPHVGGNTHSHAQRSRRLVRDQLARFAAGEPLLNVVAGQY